MNFNEKQLNEENFKKFLEGKLENQKIKEVFELARTIVEYSPILELGNINNCSNCEKPLLTEPLAGYMSVNDYDISSSKIIINRSVVSKILKELKNEDSVLYVVGIFNNSGHTMSITKTCNGQYIFFNSNKSCVLEISSEEEVCKFMELAANYYYKYISSLKSTDYYFPRIKLINSTEIIKAAMEHYESEQYKGKPSSIISDIRVEACRRGIIEKSGADESCLLLMG